MRVIPCDNNNVHIMKLTTRCRYGARAVVEVARNYRKGPVKRKDITENQNIPDSYLENILIALKNRGIVKAIRGPQGGFVLRKHPASVTMFDVMLAFDDSLAPVGCLDEPEECGKVDFCPTRTVWKKLGDAQERVLKSFTIQDLVDNRSNRDEQDFNI